LSQLELFLGLTVSALYFILGYLVARAVYRRRCRENRCISEENTG